MARILDKLFSGSNKKVMKLRKKYSWTTIELDSLKARYEEEKEERLEKKLREFKRKLLIPEFLYSTKSQYLDGIIARHIQKFDIKNYLSYRAVNHGTAKSIYSDIEHNKKWEHNLSALKRKINKVKGNRRRYIAKLDSFKRVTLKLLPQDNAKKYQSIYDKFEARYNDYERALNSHYDTKLKNQERRLNADLEKIENRIDRLVARKNKRNHKLPKDVLLEVKGLKMYFGGLKAVDDLTFNVKKGEIFGLIGPNGAGKTTVFNCVTRFYDATGGDIHFENKYGEVVDLRNFKVHDIILQGIGRTFQNIELVKEISVIENLLVASTRSYKTGFIGHALGFKSLKKEEELLRKKAEGILKFMGLDSYTNWIAMGLPYGVLKKVEIARALMADAKLIIMDEPAAGLNDAETAELTKTIRAIRDKFGVTILLVEHDMGLVMNVCDTICAISFGQMLAIGTPEQIQKNKAVQEAYLGVEEGE